MSDRPRSQNTWHGDGDHCPCRKPKPVTGAGEPVDSWLDEGCLQADLGCVDRTVPVTRRVAAEVLVLQHQLNVLQRKFPRRVTVSSQQHRQAVAKIAKHP